MKFDLLQDKIDFKKIFTVFKEIYLKDNVTMEFSIYLKMKIKSIFLSTHVNNKNPNFDLEIYMTLRKLYCLHLSFHSCQQQQKNLNL